MIQFVNANALNIPLSSESVQCVITSPPYWGLRDYGNSLQLGLEKSPDCLGWATGSKCGKCYVCSIRNVFLDIGRVLKTNGTAFLNLGDTYIGGGRARGKGGQGYSSCKQKTNAGSYFQSDLNGFVPDGMKAKDLCGIPWRVALALQSDGWYFRSDIIWSKPNPMPESVTDRPTKAHEYIFLLSKSASYYYDAEAVKEPAATGWNGSSFTDERDQLTKPGLGMKPRNGGGGYSKKYAAAQPNHGGESVRIDTGYRNKRSVWNVPTQAYAGAHFATFPEKLVEPMVLAGSRPGDIVLDPFSGSGTVGKVCAKHSRSFVGLDLNTDYIDLALDRTAEVQRVMI